MNMPYDISSLRSIYISTKTDDWKRFLVAPQLEAQGLKSSAKIDIISSHDNTKPKYLLPILNGQQSYGINNANAFHNYYLCNKIMIKPLNLFNTWAGDMPFVLFLRYMGKGQHCGL